MCIGSRRTEAYQHELAPSIEHQMLLSDVERESFLLPVVRNVSVHDMRIKLKDIPSLSPLLVSNGMPPCDFRVPIIYITVTIALLSAIKAPRSPNFTGDHYKLLPLQ